MKRLSAILLLVFAFVIVSAQPADRPTVAVVLSGGGAKGVAHIGALRAIEQAGLPIDIMTGTSMGSLIGALYSIGYTTDQLDSLVLSQDWLALFTDRPDPGSLTLQQRQEQNTYALIRGIDTERAQRGGAIRGRNLMRLFNSLCHEYSGTIDFDSLPIRYACVATDIVTNTEVDFRHGVLVQAMRASMAIPGAFTPVRLGDSVLVDGGLKNNYPADLAKAMGADIIIGVSVQAPSITADQITDAASVLNQIVNINCRNKFDENVAISDVFIRVDVQGFSSASYSAASTDSLIHRGMEAAMAHWDELLYLRRKVGLDSVTTRRASVQPLRQEPEAAMVNQFPKVPVLSVGFRFDTEEHGALTLDGKLPLGTRLPSCLQATVRLGNKVMARAALSSLTRVRGLNPTLAYTYVNNDLDIYSSGTRAYNVRYRTHTVDLTPLDLHLRRYDLRVGVRWDYFDFFGHLLASGGTIQPPSDGQYLTLYAASDLNTEDNWYFPTRGTRFHAAYSYHAANLFGVGLNDVSMHWRVNLPFGEHWTLQPMVYGRAVLSADVPLVYRNVVGGEWIGHRVDQQLPMAGVGQVELVGNYFLAAQLQLQCHLVGSHYVLLRGVAAVGADATADLVNSPSSIFGLQGGYSYNTFFGPLGVRMGYSSRTRSLNFFINIGHQF
ncbi:MAG: patatin-like phospholipase family protein [Bacteroidales bacterium]|nr:patatin-like phospholipase family protein [Bacteroidales bacterium]